MEKVYVSRNTANYIELCKELNLELIEAYTDKHCKTMSFNGNIEKAIKYARENQETFAMAWIVGYKLCEPKYRVKVKAITVPNKYLVYGKLSGEWWIGIDSFKEVESSHTRKTLEDAGFGWVFDCDGVDITEVN